MNVDKVIEDGLYVRFKKNNPFMAEWELDEIIDKEKNKFVEYLLDEFYDQKTVGKQKTNSRFLRDSLNGKPKAFASR